MYTESNCRLADGAAELGAGCDTPIAAARITAALPVLSNFAAASQCFLPSARFAVIVATWETVRL